MTYAGDISPTDTFAAEQLPLASRVLVHDLVDELADADVAQLLYIKGPLAPRLETGRAQLLDEPGEQLLLRALRGAELRHLADDVLAEPGLCPPPRVVRVG